jgi:hypothetical protein
MWPGQCPVGYIGQDRKDRDGAAAGGEENLFFLPLVGCRLDLASPASSPRLQGLSYFLFFIFLRYMNTLFL